MYCIDLNYVSMKPANSTITLFFISSVFFLLYFGFSSCKKVSNPNGNQNGKDTITYDLLKTSIYVKFVDANTNELIIPSEGELLKVQIVGKSKEAVADIIGFQKDEYITKNGTITFGLIHNAEFIPDITSPVMFTIIAHLQQYFTAQKEIVITNEGNYMLTIFMVNIDDPPPGVAVKQSYGVGTLINGVIKEDINISTQNNEVLLTIPAGIKLMYGDSTNLAGKLNITLAYFNSKEDASLAAFPGGLVASTLNNGTITTGVFFTAGAVAISIYDSDWHKASIVENDSIKLSMLVSGESYNPITEANVIIGDSVPYYSYLADTGSWVFNSWVKITDTVYNGLYSTIKTTNLNYANFSWFEDNNCNNGAKFKLSGYCSQCTSVAVNGIVRKQADNTFVSSIAVVVNSSEDADIPFSTGNTPIYIDWGQGDACNYCYVDASVNPLLIDEMCSQQVVELPIADDAPPASLSMTANFSGLCTSDTNVLILPSFGLWIRPVDAASCWRWTPMKNGVAQICNVTFGNTYVLGTYYDGNWKEWEITITEATSYNFSINFSQSVCTNVFGIL